MKETQWGNLLLLPKQLNNIDIHSSEKEIGYYVQPRLNNTNIHQRIWNPAHSSKMLLQNIRDKVQSGDCWLNNFFRWSFSSKALKLPFYKFRFLVCYNFNWFTWIQPAWLKSEECWDQRAATAAIRSNWETAWCRQWGMIFFMVTIWLLSLIHIWRCRRRG